MAKNKRKQSVQPSTAASSGKDNAPLANNTNVKFGNKATALKDLEMANQLGEPIGEALIQATQAL